MPYLSGNGIFLGPEMAYLAGIRPEMAYLAGIGPEMAYFKNLS
jgi:hypothetical protein